MSWADDYNRTLQGAQNAHQAGGAPQQSWTGGFISSTLSSIPELFGEKPTESAANFRATNPIAGIGSELLGGIVPYAITGGLSETATGARLLGTAMEAIPGVRALSAVDNPILFGAAKEAVRYSPVEIARLGVGLGTTDSWHDYGNLFADVGLSTLITGGFGGIGGFFRVGGKTLPEVGGVAGAPVGLRPTFEYRMARTPDAKPSAKGGDLAAVQNDLLTQVFQETPYKSALPGQKDAYVQGLEGGNPETDSLVSTLFRPAVGEKAGVQRLPLMDRAGRWNIDDGQMTELLGGLSAKSGGAISTVSDMAENMVFPRLVTVNSGRAAGTVSKALDDSAMQWVSDGVMAGKESNGGLHVMAVRLKAGEAPLGAADDRFVGNVPDTGVVPANEGQDGKIYLGDPNTSHYHVFEKYPEQLQGQSPKSTGFVTADGQYLNREDAFAWLKGQGKTIRPSENMGKTELDALDYRDQTRGTKYGASFTEKAPPKIGQGDQWLLFKTDKPQLFAPEGYKLAKANVDAWSKFRNAWRPAGVDDFANKDMDMMVQSFTPQDFKDRVTLPAATAKARIAERLASRMTETAGLKDSATIKAAVDNFFDVMAPTVVNERRNPLFARLFGTLRSATSAGDSIVNRMVGGRVIVKGGIWSRKNLTHAEGLVAGQEPIAAAIGKLSSDELQDFVRIGHAQAPLDKLEEYTANGLVSDNLRHAVEISQAADREAWQTHLMPAFHNANLEGKFDLLEGYIMPRLWTGDWFAPVKDEYGNLQWLANGSRRQAMNHAQTVVDEAKKAGRVLKIEEPYMMGAGKPVDQIGNLHDLVQMQIGRDGQMQEIVQRAMKKLALDQKGRVAPRQNLPEIGAPKTLTEERSGISGTPDVTKYSHQDVIKAVDNHYKQLFRFAAVSAWRNRFLPEAFNLAKQDKTLFNDLIRKQNQIMGFEGQITNTLNKALAPILGQWLGGKPATKIAVATNGLLYDWNLAIANPTFSLLNVLQPIQTVLPHMAFILSTLKRGITDAAEGDMHMTLRYGADGKPREVIGVMSPAKIMGRAFRLMGSPDEELMEHLGRAKTDGTLNAQLFEGWYGGQSRGLETIGDSFKNAGGGVAGSWEAMKRIATFTAERSEEVSRGIAFNSYYILGKDYLGLEGDKLYRFMKRGTHNSMFGYSLIDRSRMFTGPIGSMFGLFKNWQMHFISSMFQYAKLGWNQGAWAPLLWQFGVAGSIGGLGAMGPLKWVADGLSKWNDNSPNSYLWMQEHWHDSADEIYFGLPALFGASLQASSTLPGTDVRNDLTSLSNFVFLERAKAAGKAVGAAWDYGTANGANPLNQPNVRDQLMQAFAPRAFFRAFASVEGDYVKSMSTGYPQVRDVNPLSKMLYGMGLNQVDVERQQIAAREMWKDQTAQRANIQQLGIALADAQLNQDYDGMELINQKAVALGLPVTSVYKSARTRLNREQRQDIMSQYRGDLAARYKSAWAE